MTCLDEERTRAGSRQLLPLLFIDLREFCARSGMCFFVEGGDSHE